MGLVQHASLVIGTLAQPLPASQTFIDLVAGHGSRASGSPPFYITVWNSTDFQDAADAFWSGAAEIMKVEAAPSPNQFTSVVRGQDGTSDINHTTPGKIYRYRQIVPSVELNERFRKDDDNDMWRLRRSGGIPQVSTGDEMAQFQENAVASDVCLVGLLGGSTGRTGFIFGFGTQLNVAQIDVDHPNQRMNFAIAGTTQFYVDATGIVFTNGGLALNATTDVITGTVDGSITAVTPTLIIDNSDGVTRSLATINGLSDESILIVRTSTAISGGGGPITANQNGNINFNAAGGSTWTPNVPEDRLVLQRRGANFEEITRADF